MTALVRARPNPGLLIPASVILLGGVGAAIWAWRNYQVQKGGSSEPVSDRYEEVSPGVYMKKGVVLNDTMRAFLAKLRKKVNFDLLVTSGYRDASAQARAMVQNWHLHGPEQLAQVYGQKTADRIGPLMPDEAAVMAEVSKKPWVSRHMSGNALDFSLSTPQGKTLTGSRLSMYEATGQQGELMKAAGGMAGKVLHEKDHIHVGDISTLGAIKGAARENWPAVVGAGVLGLFVVGTVVYLSRK